MVSPDKALKTWLVLVTGDRNLFIHPFNKYLFFVSDVLSNILDARDVTLSQTKLLALMKLHFRVRETDKKPVNKQINNIMPSSNKCFEEENYQG